MSSELRMTCWPRCTPNGWRSMDAMPIERAILGLFAELSRPAERSATSGAAPVDWHRSWPD